MGNSLLDQLKKSGLVDKSKAQKAKHDQYKKTKQQAKSNATEVDEAKAALLKAQAEKVERDRLLNLQRKEEADRKAIAAQIRQLIETHAVKNREGDIAYHFTDANRVKTLYVSAEVHKYLSAGHLVVAKLGDSYAVVPKKVAEKIKQRDAQSIITNESPTASIPGENDPYADYKIPDDLMW
ncbi:MAG: DUF2058 domain-containing protein [Gammaproteobacteria bacterium]|nr:DUF2058 domain-containing protein [Gammaproteobacteria bacterium]